MNFDLAVVHGVREIGQESWDHLGGGQPFASYRWYRFGETVLAGDEPVYIVLSQGDQAIARGTFWLKRQEPLPISLGAVRRLMQTLINRWPLLMCHSPLANAPGLILPDPPLRDAALETIAQAALEIARQKRASFVLFPHLERHETSRGGWPAGHVPVTVPGPGTRLKIAWPDFESYLKSLRKSARKDYRRHRNRAADQGVQVTSHREVTAVDEAMVMIRNVEQHHHSPPNPWARLVLENAGMVDATWLTAEIKDRLVGCGLLLGEGDVRFLALLGLDYSVQYAYFQLVYAAIRCAIEQGVKVLRGGGGAYELKQRLGFQLETRNNVVFAGRGALLHKLGHWVAGNNA